jgi:FkbM family methyltransferase
MRAKSVSPAVRVRRALRGRLENFFRSKGYEFVLRHGTALPEPAAPLRPSFDLVMSAYLLHHPRPFFVQIGAFDGITNDPLHPHVIRHDLHGLLVEPQEIFYKELRANYGDRPGLSFERAAIADSCGTRKLYRIRPEYAEEYPDSRGMASFSLRKLQKHFAERFEHYTDDYITSESVPCLTFGELLKKHNVNAFDILQVDVEGYDHRVLEMVDLERNLPDIIQYESINLSPTDHRSSMERLARYGYSLCVVGLDTLAVQDFLQR